MQLVGQCLVKLEARSIYVPDLIYCTGLRVTCVVSVPDFQVFVESSAIQRWAVQMYRVYRRNIVEWSPPVSTLLSLEAWSRFGKQTSSWNFCSGTILAM